MRIGEILNLSTFGAVGDKPEVSTLYPTNIEWLVLIRTSNLGGTADSFRPIFMYEMGGFFDIK